MIPYCPGDPCVFSPSLGGRLQAAPGGKLFCCLSCLCWRGPHEMLLVPFS
ncbi:unnamed protein product [Staurois parvus]|uniref:Uncharacterized protein n=1 Tax=Staurois parvus TaxID=386267 RepID=A0ABN9FEM8_9NEOB|nr:unnamed protein product [Staurois parvus]